MIEQLAKDVVAIFLFSGGLVVGLFALQWLWCSLLGRAAIYISGWIGTPVHEASHAVICIIFSHKIEEISFFHPEPGSGVLGYVVHSYNPTSLFQRVGMFFIGIAPLFGNLGLAYLLYTAMPGFTGAPREVLLNILFGYFCFALIMHASPSPADLKGSLTGFVTLTAMMIPLWYYDPSLILQGTERLLDILQPLAFNIAIALGPLSLALLGLSLGKYCLKKAHGAV